MDVYNVAGSRIYIGGVISRKSTMALADFTGQTFVEIGGWSTAGAIGDSSEITSTPLINERRVVKTKGVDDAGDSENTFIVDDLDAGQIALLAAKRSCDNFAMKIEWANGCERTSTVTMTIAGPGVITWTAHGLTAGASVKFATTGALPTGITAGTTYYVIAAGLTTNTFQIATTPGGAAITTSGTQSGVHTATGLPPGRIRMFAGLVTSYSESGGDANAAQMITSTIAVNSNIVRA